MESIYLISGIISLIAIICFFIMSYHISKIKKKLYQSEDFFHQKFIFLISIGEKEAAKKLLIDRIESDSNYFPLAFFNKEEKYSRDVLQKKYCKFMDLVGLSIEEEKVIETLDYLYGEKEK